MDQTLNTTLPDGFDPASARWARFVGNPRFTYPIDYSISVVEADADAGRIDFLVRWEANAYCHYHRHLGVTKAVVIEGEQHITEHRELETVTKVRRPGFIGNVPDGETHMECAGPDGLTMLFSTHAPDGRLFEVLDDAGNVIAAATIEQFCANMAAQAV